MSDPGPPRARRAVTAPELRALTERPEASAVLLDIDGTLAPIVARAELAEVPAAVRDLVSRLSERYALVACISGRGALDARRLVGLDGLTYVGNHGYETLRPGDPEPALDTAAATRAARPREFLERVGPAELDRFGLRVEDKGPIQSLHWRGAADEAEAEAGARELAARAQSDGLVPRWGRKVLELRPIAGVDKGSAVHRLLVAHAPLAAAMYAGDDRTDLDAFHSLRALAGSSRLGTAVCVGVASDEGPAEIAEEADVVVQGTEEMAGLLEALAG